MSDINDLENGAEIVESLCAPETADGMNKSASDAGTDFIRARIREGSFARLVCPPEAVDGSKIVATMDESIQYQYEMEPMSPGAVTVNFNSAADAYIFSGKKFRVTLFEITTREYTKNTRELMTYKNDIKDIFTENALKDISTTEDTKYMGLVTEITGTSNGTASSITGVVQCKAVGAATRSTWQQGLNYMEDMAPTNPLNTGVALVNRKTFKKFVSGLDRNAIGGDLAEKIFIEGASALSESKLFNVRHLITIKSALVPDDIMYTFAEPNYLGKFLVLEEPVMHVEKKKNIIRFSARECIGFAIANYYGVARINFA